MKPLKNMAVGALLALTYSHIKHPTDSSRSYFLTTKSVMESIEVSKIRHLPLFFFKVLVVSILLSLKLLPLTFFTVADISTTASCLSLLSEITFTDCIEYFRV